MKYLQDSIWFTRLWLFAVSIIFGILFHITFLWVIALWYAIIYILEKVTGLKYTVRFETTLLVFIILSSYLGTSLWFYDIFWWWDKMLHFMYGFCFAFIGFKIIESVFKKRGVKNQLFITTAFAFCFAVALWAIWEIAEYIFDIVWIMIWGFDWRPLVQTSPWMSPIDDTMQDIIIETISAGILNIMLYCYYRFGIFEFFHTFELTINEKRKKFQKRIKKNIQKMQDTIKEKIEK